MVLVGDKSLNEIKIGDSVVLVDSLWMEFINENLDDILYSPQQFIPPVLIVEDIEEFPYVSFSKLFISYYKGIQICFWESDVKEVVSGS